VDEYERVTILWDCLDVIEGWLLAKAEPKRTELLTESEFFKSDSIIPTPLKHPWWQKLLGGSFLDVIYDCPHEIQELTSSRPVFDMTVNLSEKQKEILYYLAVRQWSPQQIAALRGQTDRNIRKVYTKMIEDIRHKMYERLYPRYKLYWSLTVVQTDFIEWYINEHSMGKIREVLPEKVKTALRRAEDEAFISANKSGVGEIQCVCIPSGEGWEFIHHAGGKSTALCLRSSERENSGSGSSECGAACNGQAERRALRGIKKSGNAVCIKIWATGVYACYTYYA
jgi:hypothetical protein